MFAPAAPHGANAPNASSSPTSPPTASARSTGGRSASPAAAGDFNYFRATDVTSATGGSADDTDEPSVANDGNNVLYTGNWYGATSSDSGHTFSYVDPYTLGPTPTLPNGGFCCDQVAIHSPSQYDITAWGLLYCNVTNCTTGVGDNIIRLAVARNQADLASSTFDYYDFSAQTFGFPQGDWLDYPHFGLGANSLYLSMNVFNGGTFVSDIMVRYDLNSFTTGNWSASWYTNNQDFTWTPTDTSHDSFGYWAATKSGDGTLVRVYNWPEGTDFTHVGFNDFAVTFNSENKNGSCAAPDGQNWCAFNDSRVKTGGEVGTSTVYFMWDAKQGGSFPYPYTEWASFDVSTGPATSIAAHQIWNSSFAWQFPGLGIDNRGNLGVSIQIGGGGTYPQSQFLLNDDLTAALPSFSAFFLDSGAHSNTRWGDFLTARPATLPGSTGNTWLVTGFTLHDNGSGGAVTTPHFYWVGRQRDDPFAPVTFTNSGLANSLTEGKAAAVFTGFFYGPSNCTCDYFGTNGWGDSTSSAASIGHYPGFTRYFIMGGSHAYAEEGSYTTSLSVSDFWAGVASASGSSSVADAPLTATGTTLNGTVGTAVSGVVAHFTDADPAGTTSDYSATINWGDSTTSPGTIGAGFTVSGSHTYTTAGTRTITVSIFDVGGAHTTATGTANIQPATPAITSVVAKAGPPGGGQTVTITGARFTGASAVKFGTTAATSFTLVSSTKITAKVPAHAAGTVDVRVTTPKGTSPVVAADHYTYETAPTVSSVAPTSGTHLGGQTVTITGTNFTGATTVKFGTTAATNVTVVSSTKVTAKSPAHAAATVDVRVTTPSGTSAVVVADHYKYV